ncbi:hypothetical protein TNIN_492471 [Trichonephila inaurata madagascariensis]|uniref:Uncharacterized protein n=1 Tax=Trichonephila inaurata madagascariensis TaxID=2747483 RepID=A0A8X6XTR7_9ARAC|nr:hypothetical protein TNIN_492471 [Trichonephila inaurata madagascariensis]
MTPDLVRKPRPGKNKTRILTTSHACVQNNEKAMTLFQLKCSKRELSTDNGDLAPYIKKMDFQSSLAKSTV